jgi:hypothetical protein
MKLTKEEWNNIGMKKSEKIENTKSDEQKLKETLNFFRMAFCVDESVENISKKGLEILQVIKLVDSKRGTFYIGVLEESKDD